MIQINNTENYVYLDLPRNLLPAFKEMVARGMNVWPDAPAELKEFHDILLHGYPLQNYYNESRVTPMEELSEAERFKLHNAPSRKPHKDTREKLKEND